MSMQFALNACLSLIFMAQCAPSLFDRVYGMCSNSEHSPFFHSISGEF